MRSHGFNESVIAFIIAVVESAIALYNVYTVLYIHIMEFEWDEDKDKANQRKHQISFEEAAEVFYYPIYETVDTRFEYEEVRLIGIGRNRQTIILTVVYTEREERIRIISARRANKQEEKLYYEYCTQTD